MRHILLTLFFLWLPGRELLSQSFLFEKTAVLQSQVPKEVYEKSGYNFFVSFYANQDDLVDGLVFSVPIEIEVKSVLYCSLEDKLSHSIKCQVIQTNLFSKDRKLNYVASLKEPVIGKGVFIINVELQKPILFEEEASFIFGILGKDNFYQSARRIVEPNVSSLDEIYEKKFKIPFTLMPESKNYNYVLSLDSAQKSNIKLSKRISSSISFEVSYVLSMFFKTISRKGMLFSTWTGQLEDDYPLEIEVDEDGKLKVFAGNAFTFHEIESKMFVATGQWHQLRIEHSSEQKVLKLYIDEKIQDSLITDELDIDAGSFLVVGSRNGENFPFNGEIDDIKFFAKTKSSLLDDDLEIVDFEEDFEVRNKTYKNLRNAFIEKDFLQKPQNEFELVAYAKSGVVSLEWSLPISPSVQQSGTQSFIIEKSDDGRNFYPAGSIFLVYGQKNYDYSENYDPLSKKLIFYRVSQVNKDGEMINAKLIKIGANNFLSLITAEPNTPNPFSENTTIKYKVNAETKVVFFLFSSIGKIVVRKDLGVKTPGSYEILINAGQYNLTTGVYFYKMVTSRDIVSGKMVVAK